MASDKNDTLKGIGSAGILGLIGYSATKSNIIEDAITNASKLNGLTMGTLKNQKGELREVGQNIKTDVNALKEATDRLRRESIDRMKDNFLNQVESFFEEGEVRTSGEKRAFFAAIFDSLREEELGVSAGTEIDDLIRRAYDTVPDVDDVSKKLGQGGVSPSLNQKDKQTLISFFENTFGSNEDAIERFGKSYQKYFSSIEHFATSSRTSTYGTIKNQQEALRSNTLDEFFNQKGVNLNKGNQGIIEDRLSRLKGKLGGVVEGIAFRSYDEGGGSGLRSLYARVNFKGNKVLNIPLFLGKDESGNVIYRATENLSSRYVAPLHVIRADAILDTTSMTSTKFGTLGQAKGTGVVDFTNYIFNDILDNLRTEDIFNMSQRRINEITAYQRNFGLDAPRTMMKEGLNNNLISKNLYFNLHASRNFQSSNALVVGLEKFDKRNQQGVVKRLLNFYGDELVGVNASQTMTARYDNPYDPSGAVRLFGQIGLRTQGNLTTLDAVKTLGVKDRVLLPQTAREGQLFGRYEAIESLKGISSFGKTNLKAVTRADTGGLIGVSRNAKGTVGMNLAGFFVKENAAAKLGLAEGVSYFGGRVVTSTSMPKTVVESGIANTNLMNLLLDRQASGKGGITVGSAADDTFTVDDFFKTFGDSKGRAIIGHLDSDFAAIKRRGGLESFTLGLSEFTEESGRKRYHLIGQMNNENMNSKLFSYLVKDTTSYADRASILRKLESVTGNASEASLLDDIYYHKMGGKIGNTLLSTSAQLKKSVYNTTTSMFGALSMMHDYGTGNQASQDFFDAKMKSRLEGGNYLNRINKLYNKSYGSLANASYTERTGAYLYESIDLALESGSNKYVDQKTMGHILGSVEEFHSKFGFDNNEKAIIDLFEKHGLDTSYTENAGSKIYNSAFMQAYKSNVILAAGYATTGGVHAELGRNLARVEPRFMNYLYTNLRTNFGMSGGDATQYLSSIMLRQSGAESKSVATLGMHISMLSLSSLPGSEFGEELKSLGNISTMSSEDLDELRMFGQGKERQLSNFLARREKGQILDFANLIQDESKLNEIKQRLGGRTQIFLPGAETLENFEGFKIKGSGKTIQIEGEYTRYLTDLISSINALGSEKNDELFGRALKSFQTSKNNLATVVGTAVRQSMSGTVLGSGSYMGTGFRFGLTPDTGFEFDVDIAKRNKMRSGLFEAFNKQKGYVIFADAQTFLDGMTTYKEALKKELRVRNPKASLEDINQMTRGLTGERLREFFFSMYDRDVDAPTGLGQRNPTLGFQHNLPGINLMRYDFAEGNQDAMFKYFKEYRGTFYNEEGMQAYRDKKHSLIRKKQAETLGMDAFDNKKYVEFLKRQKEAKSKIDDLKTKLYGAPITVNGERILDDPFSIEDEKTGEIKKIQRIKRDETTVSQEIQEGRRRVTAFHESRMQEKANIASKSEAALGDDGTLRKLQTRTSDYFDSEKAFAQQVQTPLVESSYESASKRGSRTQIRAMENKIAMAISRAAAGYQHTYELTPILAEIQEQVKREKDYLRKLTIGEFKDLAEHSSDKDKSIQAVKKRLKKLYGQENFVKQTIEAKKQLESGSIEPFKLNKETGDVSFKEATTAVFRNKEGKTITRTQGPGTYLGKLSYLDGEVKNETFDFYGGERVDTKAAYQQLVTEEGYADSGRMSELRKARELNIVQKATQLHTAQNQLGRIDSRLKGIDNKISDAKKIVEELLARDTTEEELEKAIKLESEMDSMKAEKIKLTEKSNTLKKKIPGLESSLDLLVQAEGDSKLTLNKVIASETVLNFYENNAIRSGAFNDDFMGQVRSFYGQYDPNSGMSPRQFLTDNRKAAQKAFNEHIDQNVGDGKLYRNVTSAMKGMLGFEEQEFQEITRSIYDKEKGEYVDVTKKYIASETEIERVVNEIDELSGLRAQREASFNDPTIKQAVEANNAYVQTVDELKLEQAGLEELEKDNEDNLRIRKFEQEQMSLDKELRVGLSELEDQEIRESLEQYRKEFGDLTPDQQKELIDNRKTFNQLSNLEEGLGLKPNTIENMEDLRAHTKGLEDKLISYEKYDPASGEKILHTTRVDQEMDRMFLGLAKHHEKFGGQGGGLLHFPEINIEATLTNTESGKTATYGGRMDVSRFMIGDFDADIYQIFHDTNKIARKKFNQNAASFHGFYQAGGEYLFNMNILQQGMDAFSKRIGSVGMNAEEFILDQYSKEKILKDVGPIDVQVKTGMFAMVHNASQAAMKQGGDFGEYMRHTRAASALISVAQEVLVIKSKKLPIAADIADNFLKGMQSAFSTGNADQLIDFFETNVFKGGIFEGGGNINVSDVKFKDLSGGEAQDMIRKALESINMSKANFNQSLHDMARTSKDLNIMGMMSDKRAQEIFKTSQLTTTRQLRQLLSASMEGGLIGTDNTFNYDTLERGLQILKSNAEGSFSMGGKAKGVAGLALGALGASYLVGSTMSTNRLNVEEKFSDMRARKMESAPKMIGNRDHNVGGEGITGMGQNEGFYQRPINIGESYVTNNYAAKMYGEAPSYSQAQSAARRFTSAGGQAFISVQDNRKPISNSYINKSLRD